MRSPTIPPPKHGDQVWGCDGKGDLLSGKAKIVDSLDAAITQRYKKSAIAQCIIFLKMSYSVLVKYYSYFR
jgi:hypothetical protein